MRDRKWVISENEKAEKIKEYLLQMGGEERSVSSPSEIWRVKFSDSTFIYYKKGTLYSTPSNSEDFAVKEAWDYVDKIVGPIFIHPSKEFLIGLDETGKGELIGHIHLVGVLIPAELFHTLYELVNTADTKKSHTFDYWDDIFRKISSFINEGVEFLEEKIPPWHVDRYNLNKIMDIVYQRILASFFRKIDIFKCRIVIDDYGVGSTLKRFLNFLEKQGAEIIVSQKSDDTYLEAKIASVLAKRSREFVIKKINEDPAFKINGLSVGSGNAGNKKTMEWVEAWHASGKEWPWFIKRSFSPIRRIEGSRDKVKKATPPIRENLLSEDFKRNFDEGKLDIRVLSIVCPSCGAISKAVFFTTNEEGFAARCPQCKKPLKELNFTLRYYCGFIIPDSNIINRGLLGKDLEKSRFFEDFTILIPGIVRYECDTKGGKKEFERLAKFASISRIKLKEVGEFNPNKFKNLTSQQKDDLIIETCIKENAILLSADKQVKGIAVSRDIFMISAL
ncbi:hypothetical protein IX53_01045 [Kosmotoga pacifica]|uniref:Ribonuclease n=2 Tax=Kosmotoga pacifica TaxID=1330330 RepID=A0A0G2ZAN2_9BACT|nr:hypothetical protein IX53_01045 [Kosmotoga pacifica]